MILGLATRNGSCNGAGPDPRVRGAVPLRVGGAEETRCR